MTQTVPSRPGKDTRFAVTILKTPAELYAFWRQPENLAQVVPHGFRITAVSPVVSHWETTIGGKHLQWDAVIFEDKPGELIAWRTQEGSDVASAGTVRFEPAPGDYGTEVRVQLKYDPPGGKLAGFLATVAGREPLQEMRETLRRLKALMEAGEIPTTEGQSVGEPQASKTKGKA